MESTLLEAKARAAAEQLLSAAAVRRRDLLVPRCSDDVHTSRRDIIYKRTMSTRNTKAIHSKHTWSKEQLVIAATSSVLSEIDNAENSRFRWGRDPGSEEHSF